MKNFDLALADLLKILDYEKNDYIILFLLGEIYEKKSNIIYNIFLKHSR